MIKLNDTLEARFAKLEPFIESYGPKDDKPRPCVIMFHGCGGKRPHINLYAETVPLTGARVFVVDSFAARGWNRAFAVSLICTGMVLQGYERAGDVLSVIWGLSQRADVDANNIILLGESHGGWSIMDLMTEPLDRPGQVRIENPRPELLDGVKGLFLIYPYVNFPTRTNLIKWVHKPRSFFVIANKDHLTPRAHLERIIKRLSTEGIETETLNLEATHAFDELENQGGGIMRYDAEATRQTLEALMRFTDEVFGLAGGEKPASEPDPASHYVPLDESLEGPEGRSEGKKVADKVS